MVSHKELLIPQVERSRKELRAQIKEARAALISVRNEQVTTREQIYLHVEKSEERLRQKQVLEASLAEKCQPQIEALIDNLAARRAVLQDLRQAVDTATIRSQKEWALAAQEKQRLSDFSNELRTQLSDLAASIQNQSEAEEVDVQHLNEMIKPLPLLHMQMVGHTRRIQRWAHIQEADAEARRNLVDELNKMRIAKLDALENERLHMVESYAIGNRSKLLERLTADDYENIRREMHSGTLKKKTPQTTATTSAEATPVNVSTSDSRRPSAQRALSAKSSSSRRVSTLSQEGKRPPSPFGKIDSEPESQRGSHVPTPKRAQPKLATPRVSVVSLS